MAINTSGACGKIQSQKRNGRRQPHLCRKVESRPYSVPEFVPNCVTDLLTCPILCTFPENVDKMQFTISYSRRFLENKRSCTRRHRSGTTLPLRRQSTIIPFHYTGDMEVVVSRSYLRKRSIDKFNSFVGWAVFGKLRKNILSS